MLLGLLLRAHGLDRISFWVDEAFSALMVDPRYARLATWQYDVHPPLYYALLSIWNVWSQSDWWLRFLSVVLGVATIPVAYGVGTRMFGSAAGLWAAALLSALHVHVAYSQEARMYTLMVLLFTGALWGLVVGARDGRTAGWIVYAGAAALLMYAQGMAPLFVVILAALFPVLAPRPRQWSDWRPWLIANAAVALAFAPYALTYARRARGVAAAFWLGPQAPEPPILTTLFEWTVSSIPPPSEILARQLGLDAGPLLGRWLWFVPVLAVLVLAVLHVPAERRWACSTLLLAYTAPILALSALSLIVRPLLLPRVLLPTVVPTVLLLGSLAAPRSTRHAWRHLGLGVVFLLLLLGSVYHLRHGSKEEWRRASQYLQEKVGPADVILFNVGPPTHTAAGAVEEQGRFLINRYDEHKALAGVRQVLVAELTTPCASGDLPLCLGERLSAYPERQVVWLVVSHTRPATTAWLTALLDIRDTRQFEGIGLARAVVKR